MTLDVSMLAKLLCERLCEDITIETRPDGNLMVNTHFRFPDGDSYPVHLSRAPLGGLQLSDQGHTLMHISYDHNIDTLLNGARRVLLENIITEGGLKYENGAFSLDTSPAELPDALFRFGQALTRIYDLALSIRSRTRSTFYEDLEKKLFALVDTQKIQPNFKPKVPNASNYPVDYCLVTKAEAPLYLYGIPNRDKAQLTTIVLAYFHRHSLNFESLIVFRNQAEIPKLVLARLTDVGGEMISSLESSDDLERKLVRHIG